MSNTHRGGGHGGREEERATAAVPLAGVHVPREGERAAVEWFRDGVLGMRARAAATRRRAAVPSAFPARRSKTTGGNGGWNRVGPLHPPFFLLPD
jgi:hypothetical protein